MFTCYLRVHGNRQLLNIPGSGYMWTSLGNNKNSLMSKLNDFKYSERFLFERKNEI